MSLACIFAGACLGVVAAFVLVGTLSDELFEIAITHAIDKEIEVAIRQSMELIIDPLDHSEQLVERLRDKIEMYPSLYALDDADPNSLAGNPTCHMFVADGVLSTLQRPEISMFQMRQSSRFEHRPGQPMDTMMEINQHEIAFSANNSVATFHIASKADLINLTAPLPTTYHLENVSGTKHITNGYATPDMRWVVSAFGLPDLGIATTSMMTIYGRVRNTSTAWAVGIDHNMSGFEELLLQGTAPFTFGTHDPNKVVRAGAHTSLYDMHESTFVTTSVRSIPLYKSDTELWPAGQTPHDQINQAYRDALSLCEHNDSCIDEPSVEIIEKHVISALRIRRPTLNLDLLIVSSAPRDYFFSEADMSLHVSIGVSVAACVLVVCGCIALMCCMRPALHRLQDNMLLASDLQNELVVHTDSILTEISDLSAVFDEMNKRLLVARSFVPEAVLLGQDTEETQDEGSATSYSVGRSTANNHGRPLSQQSSTARGDVTVTDTSVDTPVSNLSSERMARLFVMNEKRVAVLSLNLVGFAPLVASEPGVPRAQRINDLTMRLLTIVVTAAQREKGVMDSFHTDHFILTFNASRPVGDALAAAVRTAAAIQDEVSHDAHFRGSLGIAAGAAIGKAHVGTLGIDGHRRLSVVSPAYRTAIALQGVCAQFLLKTAGLHRQSGMPSTAGCVIEQGSLIEVNSSSCGIYAQLIGQASPAVNTKSAHKRVYAAHCAASNGKVESDEWLYELTAIEAADPFTEPNRAMMALLEGQSDACTQLLSAAAIHSPTSHMASYSEIPVEAFSASATSLGSAQPKRNSGSNGSIQRKRPSWGVVDLFQRQSQKDQGGSNNKPWEYVLS